MMKDTNYIRIYLYCKVQRLVITFLVMGFGAFNLVSAQTFTLATQNAYNFYNDKNDGKREKVLSRKNYQLRLKRMSQHIALTLQAPDVLALQEVENFSTLNDLKLRLQKKYNICYQAVILDGHKRVSINVAYLVSCELSLKNVSQLFKNKRLQRSKNQLFTRPPLYLNVCKASQCLHLVNVHLRSMRGLNNKKKRHRVAQKRLQQAETLATWINQFQTQWPNNKLIVLGDFNALKVSDANVDVLGIVKGTPQNHNKLYASSDKIERNLFDLSLRIPYDKRFSYRYKKKRQTLDYILSSQNLIPQVKSIHFTPINYSVSDHAGLVVQLRF